MTTIVVFVVGALAFVLGVVVDDIPGVVISGNASIMELLQLAATIAIAALVPLTVERVLSQARSTKQILVKDAEEILAIAGQIRTSIYESRDRVVVDQERKRISFLFQDLSRQVDAVRTITEEAYRSRGLEIRNTLENDFLRFKGDVTGGSLFVNDFVVGEEFLRSFEASFDRFATSIKLATHRIQKL